MKPGASAFSANLERELLRLERELLNASYRPGRYVEIEVSDPKKRIVSAAPFRDRVVHHALCAIICPIFERGFIAVQQKVEVGMAKQSNFCALKDDLGGIVPAHRIQGKNHLARQISPRSS